MDIYIPNDQVILHETMVDFSNRILPKPVHIVQYDDQLPILAIKTYLNDSIYTIPSNASVRIRFRKKDNTVVYNNALGWNNNRTIVYFEITRQMTVVKGCYNPIIELIIDGKTAGSSPILMEVDPNPIRDDDVESSDEFGVLQEYIDQLIDIIESGSVVGTLVPYNLNWYSSPTPQQIASNTNVLNQIKNLNTGTYILQLIKGNHSLTAIQILKSGTSFKAYFIDLHDQETIVLYVISLNGTEYFQNEIVMPNDTFDDVSPGFASMMQVANFSSDMQYTAGDGISISQDGVISVSYPNGDNISYGGNS